MIQTEGAWSISNSRPVSEGAENVNDALSQDLLTLYKVKRIGMRPRQTDTYSITLQTLI